MLSFWLNLTWYNFFTTTTRIGDFLQFLFTHYTAGINGPGYDVIIRPKSLICVGCNSQINSLGELRLSQWKSPRQRQQAFSTIFPDFSNEHNNTSNFSLKSREMLILATEQKSTTQRQQLARLCVRIEAREATRKGGSCKAGNSAIWVPKQRLYDSISTASWPVRNGSFSVIAKNCDPRKM